MVEIYPKLADFASRFASLEEDSYNGCMLLEILLTLVIFFLNSLLGLFVYFRNSKSWTNRLFLVLSINISIYTIVNFISVHPPGNPMDSQLFWIRIVMFVCAFLGPTLFLFIHTFPKSKITLKPLLHGLLALLTLTTAIASLSPLIFNSLDYVNGSPIPRPGILMPLYVIDFTGMFVVSFILLLKRHSKASGTERRQYKYLLLGIVSTFSLMALTSFLFVIILQKTSFVALGPLYSFILIATMSYAIFKHGLLDITGLIVRTVSFSLITFAIAAVYAIITFGFSAFLPDSYQHFVAILSIIVLGISFNPLRKIIETATEEIFHVRSYDSTELLEDIGTTIRETLSLNELTKHVMRQINQNIKPTAMAFYLLQDNKITVKNHDYDPMPNLDEETIEYLARKANKNLLVYDQLEQKKVKNILRKTNIAVLIPLKVGKKILGVFILAPKASGEAYSNQDLSVLEILGPQISVAIQNSLAFDEIKQFNITLKDKVKQATKRLRKANKHLRELDKLKDEFVYIATHELKTPVTVIKGYLSMIEEKTYGPVPKKMDEPLKEITNASQQLQLLVNDLLDIARSEASDRKVKTEPVDLTKIVKDVVKNVKSLAQEKNLNIDYDESGTTSVYGDEDRLKEVINNLLSNAIKYSEDGTISIEHTVDKDMVVTHVKDQGFGISEEDQKKLFDRFFRAENTANKVPGTGLGLFIVKQLVEKMDGKIWFSSKKGKGTTFSFSLHKAN